MPKLTNKKQFQCLVDEMAKHVEVAGHHKGLVKVDFKKVWMTVASKLNSFGPPTRDGNGWQKVWTDLKFNVKKKYIRMKKENKSNGEKNTQICFSHLEETIADILCFDKIINTSGKVYGLRQHIPSATKSKEEQIIPVDVDVDVDSDLNESSVEETEMETKNNSQTVKIERNVLEHVSKNDINQRRISQQSTNRLKLIKKQAKIQENLFAETTKTLTNIENYLKDNLTLQRERLQIEKERLELYKEKRKMASIRELDKIKLTLMELEIKRNELEIQRAKIKSLEPSK